VDLPENLSHFEVLGISENLKLDAQFLRDQFYSLSKRTHPDRYATKDARSALAAARWSTAVNRAYQTLKKPRVSRSISFGTR
jgi:molecular chaperone HscB